MDQQIHTSIATGGESSNTNHGPPASWALPPASLALPPWPCLLRPPSCLLGPASCLLGPPSCLLGPASCHGPADAPPLYLLLFTRIVEVWIGVYAYYALFIFSVIFIECLCISVTLFIWSHDLYSSVHPGEGSSSVPLLKGSSFFFLFLFSVSLELFLIRCEVKGQECLCVQIVKHSETNL